MWTLTVVLLAVSAAQESVPTELLFLDAASVGDQPWYTGLLHEMGVLGWTVAATAAAGGAWLASFTGRPASMWFLGSGAAVTLALLVDDVTGFHSELGPRLGLPKMVTVAVLLGFTVVWVVCNRREIIRTRWLTLFASLGALATSVLLDYERSEIDIHVFFEDAPKLIGIMGWATYFVFTVGDITRSVIRSRDGSAVV